MSETCPTCGKSFSRASRLETHIEDAHGGVSSKKWVWAVVGVLAIAAVFAIWYLGQDPDDREGHYEAFGLADDPYVGDPGAPIVIVAFESPFCTGCRAFHEQVQPGLEAGPIADGDVVLYYVQSRWSDHPQHRLGGIAQECAYAHGGNDLFWATTDRIYDDLGANGYGGYQRVPDYAAMVADAGAELGLQAEAEDAVACIEDGDRGAGGKAVSADHRVDAAFDVAGTPMFYVFGPTGGAEPARTSNVEAVALEMVAQLA